MESWLNMLTATIADHIDAFLGLDLSSLMYRLDTCIQRLPAQQASPFFGQGPTRQPM